MQVLDRFIGTGMTFDPKRSSEDSSSEVGLLSSDSGRITHHSETGICHAARPDWEG